ncbi:MAG: YgiT-type zinc finger protein [Tychonema bourrellyi B0820]|uniref:YgiT-type zinc finger protein n=1 Tax=Tychonema bourrellyi FEM_GT703 TaxID=2040638 RepID=A0A2G4EWE1_9CYAN|nr:YgiT-type zinc finger protein [Tychonema bourrellyi]MDQ2098873.1 YgiT-type zinc finger protein [Tychonema bourrellyi B0820]PHX53497.1 YgiT-type zinc finger protein [Tychonema bourrellyi FEM_GT703]
MSNELWKETLIEQTVNYTLEMDGNFIIIENVPARLCLETGERFFSPETVERLQQIIWKRNKPSRTLEVPVYEFV